MIIKRFIFQVPHARWLFFLWQVCNANKNQPPHDVFFVILPKHAGIFLENIILREHY